MNDKASFDEKLLSKEVESATYLTSEQMSAVPLTEDMIRAMKKASVFGSENIGKYLYISGIPAIMAPPKGWLVGFPIRDIDGTMSTTWNQFHVASLKLADTAPVPESVRGLTWYDLWDIRKIIASRFFVSGFEPKLNNGEAMLAPFTYDYAKIRENDVLTTAEIKLLSASWVTMKDDPIKSQKRQDILNKLHTEFKLQDYVKSDYVNDKGVLTPRGLSYRKGVCTIIPLFTDEQKEALKN